MKTLDETLTEIRAHLATAHRHLAKVDEMIAAEADAILEDELAERGLVLESVEDEPPTLRDSEYSYLGE